MSEMLASWLAFIRGEFRQSLDLGEADMQAQHAALAETASPLGEELLAGRIDAALRRQAQLEAELEQVSRTVAIRRDAYLAAVDAAFDEARSLLPTYDAARARQDLAAAAEALDMSLDNHSPAQLATLLEKHQDGIDRLRRTVRRCFADSAATLADSPSLAGGLEQSRTRHGEAKTASETQWQALTVGGHAVAAEIRASVEAMSVPQLQDLVAYLDQCLSDVEAECALAPRTNIFGDLDAWR
ncbi:MAG: hypothetical protein AB7G62_00690 [Magnetospirillum sp.]